MNKIKVILLQIILLISVIILFDFYEWDISFQNFFFNPVTQKWQISKTDKLLSIFFYDGIKYLIIIFGIGNVFFFIISFLQKKYYKYRYKCLYLILCLSIIPSFISFLKSATNIYCPYELKIYGGDKPQIKPFHKMPEYYKNKFTDRGKGYPAGHASGGFALLCLFFVFKIKRHKIYGLIAGFSVGWIMGFYQILRGAHFLSHTIVTMLISLIFCSSINIFFKRENYVSKTN